MPRMMAVCSERQASVDFPSCRHAPPVERQAILLRLGSRRYRSWSQPVDQAQDAPEQDSWDGELRQVESLAAAATDDSCANSYELLAQRHCRTVLEQLLAMAIGR